jgi:hypothetical protein
MKFKDLEAYQRAGRRGGLYYEGTGTGSRAAAHWLRATKHANLCRNSTRWQCKNQVQNGADDAQGNALSVNDNTTLSAYL